MAQTIRFAVEREEKLQEESLLMDKDFVVDLVRAGDYFSEHSLPIVLRKVVKSFFVPRKGGHVDCIGSPLPKNPKEA